MDGKLNTFTNLIADRASQAREGKRKFESGSSDTRGKKKARTVDRQNLPQLSSNGNHDQATEVSFFFFFYLGFLSRTFTIHGTAGEGGGYLFNSSLPLPPASQTLRH